MPRKKKTNPMVLVAGYERSKRRTFATQAGKKQAIATARQMTTKWARGYYKPREPGLAERINIMKSIVGIMQISNMPQEMIDTVKQMDQYTLAALFTKEMLVGDIVFDYSQTDYGGFDTENKAVEDYRLMFELYEKVAPRGKQVDWRRFYE